MTTERGSTAQVLKNLLIYHTTTEEAVRSLTDVVIGQADRLDGIEKRMEPLSTIETRISAIEDGVRQLQQMEAERRERELADRRNRMSAFFQQVAFVLSMILFTTPVLLFGGESPLVWLLSLVAAIAVTLAASVVTRRSGKD